MKSKINCIFIILVAAFTSCEKESKINIDNYVMNAFISDNTPFVIKATKTISVFDTATYNTLRNLEGELYENGNYVGDLTFQESYERVGFSDPVPEGYSVNGFVPKQGNAYRFVLRDGDFEIRGSDVIPKAVNFTVDTSTVVFDYDLTYKGTECILNFTDPADEDNYYAIAYNTADTIYEDSTYVGIQAYGWMNSDDPAIEYSYFFVGLLNTAYNFIFSDKYFNGKDYSIPVRIFAGQYNGNRKYLNIYLLSVSEKYYKYVTSSIKQQENNEDYYAEPTQVFNNIENGFGIFAGFSVSKQTIEFRN